MTAKKKKKKAEPLPLPLPLSEQQKKAKKKSAARYYVMEKGSHYDFDAFEKLEEALEHITTELLPNYEGDTPDDDDIVIIFGEPIPFEYETKIEAKRLYGK
jgi:pyruvate/2-oxoacid:ferredoxin oxidoreductase alpha subunit